jgi:hypothetical protein
MIRIGSFVMALLAIGVDAAAADATVYVTSESAISTYAAKRIAGSMFRKVGVVIDWGTGTPHAGTPGIWLRIILSSRTPEDRLPGALAVAFPYAGCTKGITVFYDRIQSLASGSNREALLAYVLVHEITHVLQGTDRHSEEGVMKARWNLKDRSRIFERRLAFEDDDVMLIRRGANAGCRGRPATLMGRSESGIVSHPD